MAGQVLHRWQKSSVLTCIDGYDEYRHKEDCYQNRLYASTFVHRHLLLRRLAADLTRLYCANFSSFKIPPSRLPAGHHFDPPDTTWQWRAVGGRDDK